MNDCGGFGIEFEPHFEGVKIKRGTRVKEFLYKLFLIESFFLAKSKFGQYDKNSACGNGVQVKRTQVTATQNRKRYSLIRSAVVYLCFKVFSSETVSFFLPFLRREANTLRPFADAILSRNPCLFFLFLFEG